MTHILNATSSRSVRLCGGEKNRAAPRARACGRLGLVLLGALALAAMCGYSTAALAAKAPTVLFSFINLMGVNPAGGLFADHMGNLYGTTAYGGRHGVGVVFELTPPAPGKKAWSETVLFHFNGHDGAGPYGGLIADGAGNLYGTTFQGGANKLGTVFELSPPVTGQTAWTETVLLTFNGTNGADPWGALLADGAGNLYGTTFAGVNNTCASNGGCGVVYKLSPPTAGQTTWTETVLLSFDKSDGAGPLAGLIADGAGNLFGTTAEGGRTDQGLAFELSPPPAGLSAWTETVLQDFGASTNGNLPTGVLIADGAGNLYGTTAYGGKNRTACPNERGCGVVFELSPPATGQTTWTETVLYAFKGTDGYVPAGGLIADGAGNLFGTTVSGGRSKVCAYAFGCGLVFELSPPAAGATAWTETVLRSFNGTKGQTPYGDLIRDGAGNLYGTTENGGTHNDGVVFEVTP